MDAMVCPKGHNSTEPDYCSECGAKIPVASSALSADSGPDAPAVQAPPESGVCPSCGAPRDHSGTAFCEVCGCDFAAPPEAAGSNRSQPEQLGAPAAAAVWSVTVSVDPALHEEGSPGPPVGFAPVTLELKQPVSLIGRRSEVRAIFPEIDMSHDDAVSHRHALLQLYGSGALLLRDIGSSNGTRLNGKAIDPMIDLTMKDGDEIMLGHWSKITVKAGS
jgi:hypothetical protein